MRSSTKFILFVALACVLLSVVCAEAEKKDTETVTDKDANTATEKEQEHEHEHEHEHDHDKSPEHEHDKEEEKEKEHEHEHEHDHDKSPEHEHDKKEEKEKEHEHGHEHEHEHGHGKDDDDDDEEKEDEAKCAAGKVIVIHHHHHHHHDPHHHHHDQHHHHHHHDHHHGHDDSEDDEHEHEDSDDDEPEEKGLPKSLKDAKVTRCVHLSQGNNITHLLKNIHSSTGNQYSLAFWYKVGSTPNGAWRNIMHYGNNDLTRMPGLWLYPSANNLHFRTSTSATWNDGCDTTFQLEHGKWYHIGVSVGQFAAKLFIDGKMTCEVPFKGKVASALSMQTMYMSNPWYQTAGGDIGRFHWLPGRSASAHIFEEMHERGHPDC